VDSSPIAAAITASKLVSAGVDDILKEARRILTKRKARYIPISRFWECAFHPTVLDALCKLREAFQEDCTTDVRIALRGIVLGALHGPKQKVFPSYFSNQCPRTCAPKPAYATRFWRKRKMVPEPVDVLAVIERRAKRYYGRSFCIKGDVRFADSRIANALQPENPDTRFDWVMTSPPYYGMRTYILTSGSATGFWEDPTKSNTQVAIKSSTQALRTLQTVCGKFGVTLQTCAKKMQQWSFGSAALLIGEFIR
jgi:hypothetical protein